MATGKMYDLAFQYKGTKLWQQFYDDELFASSCQTEKSVTAA